MHVRSACAVLVLLAGVAPVRATDIAFVDRGFSGQINLGSPRGSLAAFDFNNDGYQDLAIASLGSQFDRLYLNVPAEGTSWGRTFMEVTAGSGFDHADNKEFGSGPVAAADYDNDGDTDIYFGGHDASPFRAGLLYRNNGNGTFTDVSVASGIRISGDYQADAASWTDFDRDGDVDLFVANIGAAPRQYLLYRNNGDGTFTDASHLVPALPASARIYAAMWLDYDLDGYDDCMLLTFNAPNNVLRNVPDGSGGDGRRFVDGGVHSGFTFLGPAPMGIAAGDIDNDGDFDLAITDAEIGTYYRNTNNRFVLDYYATSIFGWGVSFLDVDNDGDVDNHQAGSWGAPAQNKLFENVGPTSNFLDVSGLLNAPVVASQHSIQMDFNNDGRQDMVTVNPNSFVSVHENTSVNPGNHFLTLTLRGDGVRINRDAIGAVVRVAAGGVTRLRQVQSGTSTTSTEDLRAHFGVGAATTIDSIEVVWPGAGSLAARTDTYTGPFGADQFMTLTPHCPADFNEDGAADAFDYDDFVSAYFTYILFGTGSADFNADGTTDAFDYDDFVNAFFSAC